MNDISEFHLLKSTNNIQDEVSIKKKRFYPSPIRIRVSFRAGVYSRKYGNFYYFQKTTQVDMDWNEM